LLDGLDTICFTVLIGKYPLKIVGIVATVRTHVASSVNRVKETNPLVNELNTAVTSGVASTSLSP
jgi:hypothetical protein